jgi:hypothetical protein
MVVFFLLTTRHKEIQGVGYAHNMCGRRAWVQTLLTVLVHLPQSIMQLISQLVRVNSPAPQPGCQWNIFEKVCLGTLFPVLIGSKSFVSNL